MRTTPTKEFRGGYHKWSWKYTRIAVCTGLFGLFILAEASFSITTNVRQAIQYMQKTIYTPSGGRGSSPVIEIGTNLTRDGIGNNIRVQGNIGTTSVCTTSFGVCKAIPELVSRGSTQLVGNRVLKVDANANNGYTITNSQITDDGTTVKIPNVLEVNANITVTNGNSSTILDPTKVTASSVHADLFCTRGATPTCRSIAADFYTKTEVDNATGALRQFVVNNYTTTGSFNHLSGNFYDLSGRLATQYWTTNQTITYMNANYATTGMYSTLSGIVWDLSGRLATNYYTKTQIDAATGLIRNAINSLSTRTTNLEGEVANIRSNLANKVEGQGSGNKIAMRREKGEKNTILTGSVITQYDDNIGIGIEKPTQKLEVKGTTRTENLEVNGTTTTQYLHVIKTIKLGIWTDPLPSCNGNTAGTILFARISSTNMNFYGCVLENGSYVWKILNYVYTGGPVGLGQ